MCCHQEEGSQAPQTMEICIPVTYAKYLVVSQALFFHLIATQPWEEGGADA